jgi:integrase
MLHRLFNCAIRWELIDRNPIDLVRQSSKRTKIPRVVTPEEFKKLLNELVEPYRTMALVAGCLGLRISEILGLRWGDIDWEKLTVLVQRSVVDGKVYETKTEASLKPLPIDPELADALLLFRRQAAHVAATDYIFAGDSRKPRWQGVMFTRHIKPAGVRAIGKVGLHAFRYFLRLCTTRAPTWPSRRNCCGTRTQAVTPAKREADHQVARVFLNG